MKSSVSSIACRLMLPIFLSGVVYAGEKPEIANVRFESVNDKVIVHYDLSGPQDIEYKIGLFLKRDTRKTFAYTPKLVTGDIGQGHFAGRNRQIVWDAKKEFTAGLDSSDYYFEVSAEPVVSGGG